MEEAIMICVDNSDYAPEYGDLYQTQLEAIRLYARAKLKSNPKNRLSVATLGLGSTRWPHQPHSDIERFLSYTLNIPWGGEFSLGNGLSYAPLAFAYVPLDMKKRMLFFVAGPGCSMEVLLRSAQRLKIRDVALDVVSFEYEEQDFDAVKTERLKSFVAAADRANNSHFVRVPRHSSSSVRDILVSSKILRPSEADLVPSVSSKILSLSQAEGAVPYMEEEEVNKMKLSTRAKKKSLRRNRRKKNHDSQQEASSSSYSPSPSSPPPCPPVVTLPAHFQLPQKYKNQNQLLFGSFQMHQLVDILSC